MADSSPITPTTPTHPTATRRRDDDARRKRQEREPRRRRDTGLTDDEGPGREDDRPIIDDFA